MVTWLLCTGSLCSRFMSAARTPWLYQYVLIVIMTIAASLAVSPNVRAATVKPSIALSVDTETLYLGDSVVIELEAVGILNDINTSSLFKDADLLRETTGTRIAVVQDRVVEVKLRRMEFIPRHEGTVVFGPLSGESMDGDVTSNTLNLTVLPAINTQWQPDADDLQIRFTLSDGQGNSMTPTPQNPYYAYVGQRIVADIALRHRHPITEEQLSLPEFNGFDVLPEHEQRRTVEHENKASVRVISWRYHLFAQRSGTLQLGTVKWAGVAVRSRTQRAVFDKQTPPLPLFIKPATDNASWWLPATALSLSESWSTEPRELSAGDEVYRTITLTADNVLASHLPDVVPLDSRAISSTALEQKRTQSLTNGRITASATFRFRLIAQSPIPVFLDTVRVPWYDTRQSTQREAIIPARRINIGLPDRADLLADLVLKERWLDRWLLEIRSMANAFAFWHVSLGILTLMAVLLLIRVVQLHLRHRSWPASGRGTSAIPGL